MFSLVLPRCTWRRLRTGGADSGVTGTVLRMEEKRIEWLEQETEGRAWESAQGLNKTLNQGADVSWNPIWHRGHGVFQILLQILLQKWQKSCCFLALLCKEFHLWSLRHPWISSIISSSYHRIPIFRANRRLMGDVWEASGVLTADGNSGYSCAPMKKNDWGWRCQLVSPTPNQAPPPKGKKSRNI